MKVLIVKTSSMGDIIHSFPVIDWIKGKFPEAQIDWIVEKPSLGIVEAHPGVRQAIAIDTKRWRKSLFHPQVFREIKAFRYRLQQEHYDVVFDLQGNIKSGIVTWLAKSQAKVGFSRERVPEWPNLLATNRRYAPPKDRNIRFDYLHLVQSYFQDFKTSVDTEVLLKLTKQEELQFEKILEQLSAQPFKTVMVCPGSNWKNKQLSDDALSDFLEILLKKLRCHLVFIWGSESEHLYVKNLETKLQSSTVLDKMSLPLLQNVMRKVSLVIAMDSLPLHLAATTKTATLSVFGASLASKYKPPGEQHLAFQGGCPYGLKFNSRCPQLRRCTTGACIRSLSGRTLFDAMETQIKNIFDKNHLRDKAYVV